jgi:uncharacterized membrane protein YebE (DUF533 family)
MEVESRDRTRMRPTRGRSAAIGAIERSARRMRKEPTLMIVGRMLGSLIGTALGVRGKSHHRARSFLTGGPSSFLNTSTLLTAAGLAATAYTLYRAHSTATPMSSSTIAGGPTPPPSAPPPMSAPSSQAPPPLPVSRTTVAPQPAATSPIGTPSSASSPSASTTAPVDALTRIVAIALAAARCDGELGEDEYGRLLAVAREHKAEALVARELSEARPLAELAAGVTDAQHKADLYALAYGILRADESLSSAERSWLAQWGALLGLDAATTQRLEKEVAQRIASAPASGEPRG